MKHAKNNVYQDVIVQKVWFCMNLVIVSHLHNVLVTSVVPHIMQTMYFTRQSARNGMINMWLLIVSVDNTHPPTHTNTPHTYTHTQIRIHTYIHACMHPISLDTHPSLNKFPLFFTNFQISHSLQKGVTHLFLKDPPPPPPHTQTLLATPPPPPLL